MNDRKIRKIPYGLYVRHFPRFVANALSCFVSGGKVFALPARLQVELTAICNLKCPMCGLTDMKRSRGFMNFGNFKKLYDESKPPYLNLTGYGETLLNKDLFQIIDYAKKRGSFVRFDSNGVLLKGERAQKLLDHGLDQISVSIDGATKESFEKIRHPAKFEDVTNNVKNFVHQRDHGRYDTQVHMSSTLQKENLESISAFCELGERIGVDDYYPSYIVSYGGRINQKSLITENLEIVQRQINALPLKNKRKFSPVERYLKRLEQQQANWVPECYYPWYSTFISWDGMMFPCCYYYDCQQVFGNVLENTFESVWYGEKATRFRQSFTRSAAKWDICASCNYRDYHINDRMKKVKKKLPFVRQYTHRHDYEC